MAPIRSSGKNKSSSLKQGTLSFASAKRTASTSTAGKRRKVAATTSPSESATKPSSVASSSSDSSGASTPVLLDAKAQKEDHASTTTRRLRPAKSRHLSPSPEVASTPSHKDIVVVEDAEMKEARPALNPQDRRWTKIHYAAKKRMGRAALVHAENQNKVHEILRVFDLSYEYGPCIGVSRLERWERACAMGLSPPQEIKEILDTLEGTEKPEYSQSVLYDLV